MIDTENGFGIILPNYSQTIRHKSGGVAITYPKFSGQFIPLSNPVNISQSSTRPEYPSDNPTDSQDITFLSQEKQNSLPDHIQEKGQFESQYEYRRFAKTKPWYSLSLLSILTSWNYDYEGNITGYDMRADWGSSSEIWNLIDENLPFEYDVITPTFRREDNKRELSRSEKSKLQSIIPPNQPLFGEGIRWILISEPKNFPQEENTNDYLSPFNSFPDWAQEWINKPVCLVYPNCD